MQYRFYPRFNGFPVDDQDSVFVDDRAVQTMQIVSAAKVGVRLDDRKNQFSFDPFTLVPRRNSLGFQAPFAERDRHHLRRHVVSRFHTAVPHTGGQDHQRRKSTDDQRIDKRLETGDYAFAHRLIGLRRRVGDGRRTLARFVREQRALHAVHEGVAHGATDKRPGRFVGGERRYENQLEHAEDLVGVDEQDIGAGEQVKRDHDRHQPPGDRADALDPADDDRADQYREDNAANPTGNAEIGLGNFADVPGLEHVAAGNCRDQQGDAKNRANNFAKPGQAGVHFCQAFRRDPHRPAMRIVRIVGVPVEHRQGDLGQLDRHPEEPDHPHPEDRTRPAESDGERDATDVAQADGRRQGRGQRLKMVDRARIVRIVVTPPQDMETMGQGDVLAEPGPNGKNDAGKKHEKQHVVVPDDTVDSSEYLVELIHRVATFLVMAALLRCSVCLCVAPYNVGSSRAVQAGSNKHRAICKLSKSRRRAFRPDKGPCRRDGPASAPGSR